MKAKASYLFVLFIMIFYSCKLKDSQVMHNNITGRTGELIVVMSKVAWDDKPGNLVRQILAQPQLSLPQDEPLFDLVLVPHEAFKDIFLSTRNIVQTKISPIVETSGVVFTDNVWAYPQATVQINARSNEEFEKLFLENSDKIIAYFLRAERERLAMNYKKLHADDIRAVLAKKYNIEMNIPPGFKIMTQSNDFDWIRYETPEISLAIMVYRFPYNSDSTFTYNYLLNKRDSVLKVNVPGPTKGSFMTTEKRAAPIFQITKHNGNYAADMRGLWRVENDFMGGPFLMLAELDTYNRQVIVADGYVYAPSKNKRNYIRQIEAIVYSMVMTDQEKIDKVNSQINMGN